MTIRISLFILTLLGLLWEAIILEEGQVEKQFAIFKMVIGLLELKEAIWAILLTFDFMGFLIDYSFREQFIENFIMQSSFKLVVLLII